MIYIQKEEEIMDRYGNRRKLIVVRPKFRRDFIQDDRPIEEIINDGDADGLAFSNIRAFRTKNFD